MYDLIQSFIMAKTHSESSEDFEFIETPTATPPQIPIADYGVRTTSVRTSLRSLPSSNIYQ